MAKGKTPTAPTNATKASKTAGSANRKRVMRGEKNVPGAGGVKCGKKGS